MTTQGNPVVDRYRDAYRVGAAVAGLGTLIKVLGGALAVLIFFVTFRGATGDVFADPKVLLALALAVVVGVLSWVGGVMIAAIGQILRASLDNAVASSHFLSDPERADAMGLPRSVSDRSQT